MDKNNPFNVRLKNKPVLPSNMPWNPELAEQASRLSYNVPQPTPAPEEPEVPEVSDSEYIKNIADTLERPMTHEEEERRTRASQSVASVGALGNALSAFSNLAFTGGIAPSQKLPETYDPSPDVQAFHTRVDKVRDNYLRSLGTLESIRQKGIANQIAAGNLAARQKANENTSRRLAYLEGESKRKSDTDAWKKEESEDKRELARQAQKAKELYQQGRLSIDEYRALIQLLGKRDKTENYEYFVDENGVPHVSTRTTTYGNTPVVPGATQGTPAAGSRGTMAGVKGQDKNKTIPALR